MTYPFIKIQSKKKKNTVLLLFIFLGVFATSLPVLAEEEIPDQVWVLLSDEVKQEREKARERNRKARQGEDESRVRREANKGDASALFRLGEIYHLGLGVTQNVDEAFKWYRLASRQDNAAGHAGLATLYMLGIGAPRDANKALELLRKAVEQENATGYLGLSIYYTNGLAGVRRDLAEGFRLMRKAAELGDVNAQYLLAEMYRDGNGVEKNPDEAYIWYTIAIMNGDYNSLFFRRELTGRHYLCDRPCIELEREALHRHKLAIGTVIDRDVTK